MQSCSMKLIYHSQATKASLRYLGTSLCDARTSQQQTLQRYNGIVHHLSLFFEVLSLKYTWDMMKVAPRRPRLRTPS
jgi:hypothetical protein